MAAEAGSAEYRLATYRALARRNRRVAWLRVLVPIAGLMVFAAIGAQMLLASLVGGFRFSDIHLAPDMVTVDSPRYAGTLPDGGHYRVSARSATAPTGDFDAIDLGEAVLDYTAPNGSTLHATASTGRLLVRERQVLIPGLADVSNAQGATGTLRDVVVDWPTSTLDARGPVHIANAAGSTLDAADLELDLDHRVWIFHDVTVTLPADHPGTVD